MIEANTKVKDAKTTKFNVTNNSIEKLLKRLINRPYADALALFDRVIGRRVSVGHHTAREPKLRRLLDPQAFLASPAHLTGQADLPEHHSAGPDGPLADQGATFDWRFSDGATAQGVSVAHQFARGGRQSAILTITSGNRQVYATQLDIIVPN